MKRKQCSRDHIKRKSGLVLYCKIFDGGFISIRLLFSIQYWPNSRYYWIQLHDITQYIYASFLEEYIASKTVTYYIKHNQCIFRSYEFKIQFR